MQLTPEQKSFVLMHEQENVRDLALRFSSRKDMPFLLAQIAGRQVSKTKIPSWYAIDEIIYPVHLSLEQASSEQTARYKASLVSQKSDLFVDLTGGMGVDFSFFAPKFREAVYVERNMDLSETAKHNFEQLGLKNITVRNGNGETFLSEMPKADFIYLDPSRRDNSGQKVFRIEDCSPDLSEIKTVLREKSDSILIKYSPMLDISQAVKTLGEVAEVHIVSIDNECKELLLLLSKAAVEEPRFIAVNIKKSDKTDVFSFTVSEEQKAQISFADKLCRYLYEPNASILKAGAFKSVAKAYDVTKLHTNSHLYTSDKLIADFPGRIFEIEASCSPNKRELKPFLSETKKANIAVRNFPMSVAEIRRKTNLKEGGDVYLFATTLADERKVWIKCRKVLID